MPNNWLVALNYSILICGANEKVEASAAGGLRCFCNFMCVLFSESGMPLILLAPHLSNDESDWSSRVLELQVT